MSKVLSRREVLKLPAAVAAAGALVAAAPARYRTLKGRVLKAVKFHMVREELSIGDKFKLVKDLGFDGIEVHKRDMANPAEFHEASHRAKLPIHGILNSSDLDLRGAVDLARNVGATSVLVVAGQVNAETPYDQNYTRTRAWIAGAAYFARGSREKNLNQIDLLVENVWNEFLLSPIEMARYIDEIKQPNVGVYFDIGNVVRFGWPEQWIRILGRRVRKLDVKEYSRAIMNEQGMRKGFDVPIGEGDIDWAAVREALIEIGYSGWATAEVPGGDRKALADIARRMDQVLGLA